MARFSPAVAAARARRSGRAGRSSVEIESYVDEVSKRIDLTLKQRMMVTVAFLQNQVVKNISVPVTKEVIGRHVRVTERSKPGEYSVERTRRLSFAPCFGMSKKINQDGFKDLLVHLSDMPFLLN